ncbi:putative membrane protein [Candidatus Protochlamydia naegleriophila]|uniref:Putative membrane protein n=1 Tax=Candidatus Protochlamydia naegleriophila TaxID=389348 RepID=A0A0U5JAF7_9BACT|nr:hypothetical protein [Candidatus Protochlamydia naegleriophila]CUI16414.1 putative membrane protein [Candidatus Protochlamydia naegleriophila]
MNWIKRCFHFLGGIYLAIVLIGAFAAIVVAGTIIESYTDSHLYAAEWTYQSPFFHMLLWLLFINILFAALRRWPFKPRHIPFLITHLGLLMVIGGTIIKQRTGIQGNLNLWEGSANQTLLLPNTHALQVEKIDSVSLDPIRDMYTIALGGRQIYQQQRFPNLKIKILGQTSHVSEVWETWIKGDRAYLTGLLPFPVQSWNKEEPFPKGVFTLLAGQKKNWNLLALRSPHLQESVTAFYLDNLTLRLSLKNEPDNHVDIALQEALANGVNWHGKEMRTELDLAYSPIDGFNQPLLALKWETANGEAKHLWVNLLGSRSLYVNEESSKGLPPPFEIDLIRPAPALLLVEDEQKDTFLFAFDEYGRVHGEAFRQGHLQSLLAYEHGYAGYAVQAQLPIPSFPNGRLNKESADAYFLSQQLRQALQTKARLAPPLELFAQACQQAQTDFVDHFIEFLQQWDNSRSPLISSLEGCSNSLKTTLTLLNWQKVPALDQKASHWTYLLFEQLQAPIQTDEDLMNYLKERQWPFLKGLEDSNDQNQSKDLLTRLAQQLFAIAHHLPDHQKQAPFSTLQKAQHLSAYLKAFGIDYQSLLTRPEEGEETFDRLQTYWQMTAQNESEASQTSITLETPLTVYHKTETPLQKREDNRPGLFVEVQEGTRKQLLSLAYDSAAMGLKWPILNGHYLIRFQPSQIELPYRLRLRQARQINYPHTQQPYSYEGDLLISDAAGKETATTLSMNRVFETWDGFRFYLAGMHSTSPQNAKRVQIIVNQDPAKYFLTYPGALIVTLGTTLLFWLRPYRKRE